MVSVFGLGIVDATTCYCSATGDPHIRDFSTQMNMVGAGSYTLLRDSKFKYTIKITVTEVSPGVTKISDVYVRLRDEVVNDIPGYGKIYKSGALEVRVLNTNNVFIRFDDSQGDILMQNSFCGTTCSTY